MIKHTKIGSETFQKTAVKINYLTLLDEMENTSLAEMMKNDIKNKFKKYFVGVIYLLENKSFQM
jgi:hypothetical protein